MDQALVTLASGHPLIDIDWTVLVQFGLFLLLLFVSNKLLFQPYLRLRERRKEGIAGAPGRLGGWSRSTPIRAFAGEPRRH